MMSASVVIPMEQFIMAAAEIFRAGCTELSSFLRAKLLVGLERINIPEAAYVSNLWLLACLESGNTGSRRSCDCGWTQRRGGAPLKWCGVFFDFSFCFFLYRGLFFLFCAFFFFYLPRKKEVGF